MPSLTTTPDDPTWARDRDEIERLRAENIRMADRIRAFDGVLSAAWAAIRSRDVTARADADGRLLVGLAELHTLSDAIETYRNQGNAYLPESPLSRLVAAACAERVTAGPLYAAVKQYIVFVKQARESGAPIS